MMSFASQRTPRGVSPFAITRPLPPALKDHPSAANGHANVGECERIERRIATEDDDVSRKALSDLATGPIGLEPSRGNRGQRREHLPPGEPGPRERRELQPRVGNI